VEAVVEGLQKAREQEVEIDVQMEESWSSIERMQGVHVDENIVNRWCLYPLSLLNQSGHGTAANVVLTPKTSNSHFRRYRTRPLEVSFNQQGKVKGVRHSDGRLLDLMVG
jgi:hypothetical protein